MTDVSTAGPIAGPVVEEADPESSRDERLRALVKQRATTCAALSPSRTDNFLLAYPRLPRVGNSLLCAVLSACSQHAIPCHGGSATDPTMCPGGAPWQYTDLGAAKLHKEAYGCSQRLTLPVGSATGWDKLMGSCATHGGDIAATCSMMRATTLPATLMLQHETFFEPQAPPCGWSDAPLRFVTLLRDPGERAQSAYEFGLNGCICNFKFAHCTMFTSFRFNTRRSALCDANNKPKHSFHEAVTLLRESGIRDWPVATDNEQFVLGRYASAMIKNVYSTYYGGYRLPPPANDANDAIAAVADADAVKHVEGGAWLASPALARATLAHCFTWVGISEEMPLSLQLLRYELPQFFRNLNTAHPAFGWTSALNRAGEPSNNLTHPFLRAHLLTDDYKLYDIERARLLNRATKFGLAHG